MKQKSAFTLIEMLLAMAIFGIIALLMISHSNTALEKLTYRKLSFSAYNFLRTGVGNYISQYGKITDAKNLCKYLVGLSNSNLSDPDAIQSACSNTVSDDDFNDSNVNFTLSNGMAFFDFGKGIRNAVYSDGNLVQGFYIVYVDIDGKRGQRKEGKDVIGFIINLNGEVLPYGKAATDTDYFLAGYRFLRINPDNPETYEWVWLNRKATFQEAICRTGVQLQTSNYCGDIVSVCNTLVCRYEIIN